MRKLLVAALICCSGFMANEAKADFCDMASCGSTITLDSGVGKNCAMTGSSCECAQQESYCGILAIRKSICNGVNWNINNGNMIGGGKCCGWSPEFECPSKAEVDRINAENAAIEADRTQRNVSDVVNQWEKAAESKENLGKVFSPNFDNSGMRTDVYFGWKDDVIRSPNNGRAQSAAARLDACLFHTDVDAIDAAGGTMADKLNRCYGSTYGCGTTIKNEYCQATGTNDGVSGVTAAVCKDRCDCLYGGTCAGI